MTASASLTLAVVHLIVWSKQKDQDASLAFSLIAASVAGLGGIELAMMHAQTPEQFGVLVRWAHVPIWVLTLSLVWFTLTYLGAGRLWLAWIFVGLRSLTLVLNFLVGVNLNLREITELKHLSLLGQTVAVPVGVPSPWMLLGQASLVLLIAFILDAAVKVWQVGDRRRAVIVGGSMIFFVAFGQVESALVFWGIINAPIALSVGYLAMLVAMGYELSRDISSRRKEIAQLRETLAHVGRVSTMEQLASGLAHELNQPLAAILFNADAAGLALKAASPDLEELREIIADIRKDDKRASEVIKSLRGLLQRRDIETRSLNLYELLDDVAAVMRTSGISHRVKLLIKTAPDLPFVRGDRVQLQQVLINLLLNAMEAVKGLEADQRVLTVRALRNSAQMVEVTVTDLGHGIARDVVSNIFEPFFTTKPQGLGMGLPISRTIIEAHGGRIWAENNLDGGATFGFTLSGAGNSDLKTSDKTG